MLIEQFFHGLDSRDTCDEIISQKPEKFEKAYEIASQLKATQHIANVVKISTNPAGSESQTNKLGFSKPKTKPYNLHARLQSQGRSTSNSSEFGKQQANKSNESHAKNYNCGGCNGKHPRRDCPYKDAICHFCHTKGHKKSACRKLDLERRKQNQTQETLGDAPAENLMLFTILILFYFIKYLRFSYFQLYYIV